MCMSLALLSLSSSWAFLADLSSPYGPQRSIRIHARLLIINLHLPMVRFRVLPKHDDLRPMRVERLLGIRIRGALNGMNVRKNDVRASSVRSCRIPPISVLTILFKNELHRTNATLEVLHLDKHV